jgi:hypothetical protein
MAVTSQDDGVVDVISLEMIQNMLTIISISIPSIDIVAPIRSLDSSEHNLLPI